MQKKIIALAVAGLVSGAAFAQTNVTVYGVADIGYNYASSSGGADGVDKDGKFVSVRKKFSGMQDGGDVGLQGSRIGFRGEEALGNGLKAVFTVEFGYNLSSNSSGFSNNRQAFVGLAGNLGTLTFGRQYAPSGAGYLGATSSNGITSVNISNYLISPNASPDTFSVTIDGKIFKGTYSAGVGFTTMNTGNGSRWDNSIAYDSPNWSGFQLRAIYSFGDNVRDSFGDASSNGGKFGLGAKYANGPLYLTAIYQSVLKNDGKGPGSNKSIPWSGTIDGHSITASVTVPTFEKYDTKAIDAWAIGGSYDFKVVKVFANYIQEKDKNGDIMADYDTGDVELKSSVKKTYWSLGASVPVSAAGTVKAEYGRYKTNFSDTRSHGLSVGYEHAMSKRTTLYAYVARLANQDSIGSSIKRGSAAVGVNGENQTAFAMGFNHKF
ncbi:MAG: porin [Candidatus Accumulibacter sp.]|jgi:predicted porin|nr:porin [Accumulibacter sp.]